MNSAFVAGFSAVRPSVSRASLCSSKAFFGARAVRVVNTSPAAVRMAQILPVFTRAMESYKKDFPYMAEKGWGATVKAERWNGRHAMFGLMVLVITGYCKSHNLIPDPDMTLDLSVWGPLAALGDQASITNERAIILIAHVHVLLVSIAAAIAPFSFQDTLLIPEGQADEKPAGLFPPFVGGLTKEAELWNGRVAMLGVSTLVGIAISTGTPILDVLNAGLGNLLF